jgi:hypothetical protein
MLIRVLAIIKQIWHSKCIRLIVKLRPQLWVASNKTAYNTLMSFMLLVWRWLNEVEKCCHNKGNNIYYLCIIVFKPLFLKLTFIIVLNVSISLTLWLLRHRQQLSVCWYISWRCLNNIVWKLIFQWEREKATHTKWVGLSSTSEAEPNSRSNKSA